MPGAITVLYNPSAGNGASGELRRDLAAAFELLDIQPKLEPVSSADDLKRFAEHAVRENAPVLAAAGGDGTIGMVASALADTDTALAVLPAGTLNHFAKDAGIPLDLAQAAHTAVHGQPSRVDVAEVNGRVFINNSSLGLYPAIVRRRESMERQGYPRFPAFCWAAWQALRRYPFLKLRLEVDGKPLSRRTPIAFIGNNPYRLEGLSLGSRDTLTSGSLCLFVAHDTGRPGLLRLACDAMLGQLNRTRDFDALAAREIWMESRRRRLPVALDGEVVWLKPPLHYRLRPLALRVMLPRASR